MEDKNIKYEGKILNIDVEEVTAAIDQIGGKLVGDYTFRRCVSLPIY